MPHISVGEVIGARDSKLWVMHHAGADAVDVWAVDDDRCNMARVPMTREQLLIAAEMLTAAAGLLV